MTPNQRIAFVIPYLGALPKYTQLFFHSVASNRDIDVLLFVDQRPTIQVPSNVYVQNISKSSILDRIRKSTGLEIHAITGHKLCDFRPFYPLMFERELRGYNWWGHCDIDLMFGDLSRWIKNYLNPVYDVLTAHNSGTIGHFTIYKNDPAISNEMLKMIDNPMLKQKFLMPDNQHLDEGGANQHITKATALKLFTVPAFHESLKMSFAPFGITFCPNGSTAELNPLEYGVAYWKNGRTWYEAAHRPRTEVLYIHFMGNKNWWHWLFYRDSPRRKDHHLFSPIGYGLINDCLEMKTLRFKLVRLFQFFLLTSRVYSGKFIKSLFGPSAFRSARNFFIRSGRYS
jgi:hypothetical protein